ncbi:MAG: carbohydrate kinase family protein [Candidatus Dormibacteria bacterium]
MGWDRYHHPVPRIAVTGSVAFDTIMVFSGRFGDHILPEKTHLINVSFLVGHLDRRRGGTGANIAYTLALLGETPLLCAAVGNDFGEFGTALEEVGVDLSALVHDEQLATATAFITTDLDNNQITAFYPGAMGRAAEVDLRRLGELSHVVVAPDAPDAMARHVEQAANLGARLVFAPAQQLTSLSDEVLAAGLASAWLVLGNDYEMELIRERTGQDAAGLAAAGAVVVTTRGAAGSELRRGDQAVQVPAAPPSEVVDPTGAGDAYLAGVLHGLVHDGTLAEAGRLGALAATYVVERAGTQAHRFTAADFSHRHGQAFGSERVAAAR